MKRFPILLTVILGGILILSACGGNRNSAQEVDTSPVVRFITPADGATVSSPVTVRMNAINYTIEEAGEVRDNAGHFHIMVNQECVTEGSDLVG